MNKCTVEVCRNEVYAKGLCNGHYLRRRKGGSLTTEIHPKGGTCLVCGLRNYGLGLCKTHYRKLRPLLIKQILIERAGGACKDCNEIFPPAVFDFHHRDPKEKQFTIGQQIENKSLQELMDEADKCDLLCSNCHRIRHFNKEAEKWPVLKTLLQLSLKMKEVMFGTKTIPAGRLTRVSPDISIPAGLGG